MRFASSGAPPGADSGRPRTTRTGRRSRTAVAGFTLLELLLALALSVLTTAIIANLVQMYTSNFTTRGEDIRRIALARSILNMIADDLRSTVVKQEFDASVLQQLLTGQGGGGGGGGAGSGAGGASGASGGGASGAGADSGSSGGTGSSGGSFGQGAGLGSGGSGTNTSGAGGGAGSGSGSGGFGAGQTGSQSGSLGGTGSDTGTGTAEDGTATGAMLSSALPLGIYGSLSSLTIDVSRLPRPDEYIAQQQSIMSGELTDVPGDIKSVGYYVQVPTNTGVSDTMNEVTSTPDNGGMVGGLVRREIDRAVMANAEELGQTDQLMRTGELVAPEVISLEFSYFDGMQWLTDWDSSAQGLPLLVEISLAMQSKSGEKRAGIVAPGVSISTMPYEEQTAYGIEVYTLTVAIPGAQTQAATAATADAAAGMEAMGL